MKNKFIIFYFCIISIYMPIFKADTTPNPGFNFKDYTFGGDASDAFNGIIELKDGGYILLGSSTSSSNGDIVDINNGGFDGLIVKFDKSGNKLWDNLYGGDKNETFSSGIEDKNGNLIFVGEACSNKSGEITSSNGGTCSGLISKFDKNGKHLWDKQYQPSKPASVTEINSIIETADGNYVTTIKEQLSDLLHVVKYDTYGNILWEYSIKATGRYNSFADITELADGSLVAVGNTNGGGAITSKPLSSQSVPLILKLDKNGAYMWHKTLDDFDVETVTDRRIRILSDNNSFIVANSKNMGEKVSTTSSLYKHNFQIAKYTYDGNLMWKYDYDTLGRDNLLNSIAKTSDGGYILGGISSLEKFGDGNPLIMKIDKNGKQQWTNYKVGYELQRINKVIETGKEKYIAVGENSSKSLSFTSPINGPTDSFILINNYIPDLVADNVRDIGINDKKSDDEIKSIYKLSAFDEEDGNLYEKVDVDTSGVDWNTAGSYTITFSVEDNSKILDNLHNLGNIDNLSVTLNITNEIPKIYTEDNKSSQVGKVLNNKQIIDLFNISASDKEDGDLTSSITFDSSAVDWNTPGVYSIILSVVDSDGNSTNKVVQISIIDSKPTIRSKDIVEIKKGEKLSDSQIKSLFNVKGFDEEDGDLTSSITVDSSSVDWNTPGEYSVKFILIDSFGNKIIKVVKLKIVNDNNIIDTSQNKPMKKINETGFTNNLISLIFLLFILFDIKYILLKF